MQKRLNVDQPSKLFDMLGSKDKTTINGLRQFYLPFEKAAII